MVGYFSVSSHKSQVLLKESNCSLQHIGGTGRQTKRDGFILMPWLQKCIQHFDMKLHLQQWKYMCLVARVKMQEISD